MIIRSRKVEDFQGCGLSWGKAAARGKAWCLSRAGNAAPGRPTASETGSDYHAPA